MSTQKFPMVADCLRAMPRMITMATAMPHGCAAEVVVGKPEHLRQVAHGRFGDVRLPVGIRRKRCGGVPRQVGCDTGKSLWVPRQKMLRALHNVGEHE